MNSVNLMMMAVAAAVVLVGCSKVEKAGRSVARKGGEALGKGATEFFTGVDEGIREVREGSISDAMTVIKTRKSVRKFDPSKKVSDETRQTILKAAMCAPSALDKRVWEFVVVRDAALLAAIAEKNPYSRVGNGAQAAIIVCGKQEQQGGGLWVCDCAAASENILLAAHALGLGAVWTALYPDETRAGAIRELLAIPEGYMPLNVIPIGYPAENPEPKDKWNPDKIHYDKW